MVRLPQHPRLLSLSPLPLPPATVLCRSFHLLGGFAGDDDYVGSDGDAARARQQSVAPQQTSELPAGDVQTVDRPGLPVHVKVIHGPELPPILGHDAFASEAARAPRICAVLVPRRRVDGRVVPPRDDRVLAEHLHVFVRQHAFAAKDAAAYDDPDDPIASRIHEQINRVPGPSHRCRL